MYSICFLDSVDNYVNLAMCFSNLKKVYICR